MIVFGLRYLTFLPDKFFSDNHTLTSSVTGWIYFYDCDLNAINHDQSVLETLGFYSRSDLMVSKLVLKQT